MTWQTGYIPTAANKAWYDEDTILPGGTLRKFYLMAHNHSQLDNASTRIRLQIWRPVDLVSLRLLLVWQQLVQVAAVEPIAMVYTVCRPLYIIYTQAYMHAYYLHTGIHACLHACMHTCKHACMHACMHTYIRTYVRTYIHTYIHTYVHTYIHTVTCLTTCRLNKQKDRDAIHQFSP